MMTPKTVLNKSADLLERQGWYQNGYGRLGPDGIDREGPVCVAGAINLAITDGKFISHLYTDEERKLKEEVRTILLDTIGGDWEYQGGLVRWNDTPGRTGEDVINTLRRAADSL